MHKRSYKQDKPVAKFQQPPPHVSLKNLNEKNNNQRKPDAKHVSDLKDALKAVIGNKPITENLRQTTTSPKLASSPNLPAGKAGPLEPRLNDTVGQDRIKHLEVKQEPSPEELKKILNA